MWFLMQWSRRFVFCLLSWYGKQSWDINIVKGTSLSLQNICTVIKFSIFLQPVRNPLIYAQCICLLVSFALGIKKIYLDVMSYHIHKTPIFLQSLAFLKFWDWKNWLKRWTLKGKMKDLLLRNVDFQFQLTGTPAARLFFLIQPIICLIATGCRCPGDECVWSKAREKLGNVDWTVRSK